MRLLGESYGHISLLVVETDRPQGWGSVSRATLHNTPRAPGVVRLDGGGSAPCRACYGSAVLQELTEQPRPGAYPQLPHRGFTLRNQESDETTWPGSRRGRRLLVRARLAQDRGFGGYGTGSDRDLPASRGRGQPPARAPGGATTPPLPLKALLAWGPGQVASGFFPLPPDSPLGTCLRLGRPCGAQQAGPNRAPSSSVSVYMWLCILTLMRCKYKMTRHVG